MPAGHQYLDFFGGIVTHRSVGRSNDEVNAKVDRQLDTLQCVSTLFATEPQAAIAKKIALVTPGGQLTESLFTNGGTEANETDILSARCFTGNTEIVALRHFIMAAPPPAMTLTEARGGSACRRPASCTPHNASCYRCPFGLTYPSCEVKCAQDLRRARR
jgi:4-aminobutyrate aminotransferase-like enzyme